MIVTAFNPSTDSLEKTYLSQYLASGSTSLIVKNNDRFAMTQAILIGEMGEERSELNTTSGITGKNTVGVDTATSFGHNADDPVYKLEYNQIKFYKAATLTGTYNLLTTVDVDVDNHDKVTRYDDTTGLTTDYYKIQYYNSETLTSSEQSDPIPATGQASNTAGKVIDAVVRRVRDTEYTILSINEYIDIMNEVNDDLITMAHRPYRFLKDSAVVNTTAGQAYISLPTTLWKFDYLVYAWTTGGVTRKYRIDEPISHEAFIRKYEGADWQDDDELLDVAIDEYNNKILLGPAPKTSQVGVIEVFYYKKFTEITSFGDAVETPNTLIYRYKMLAEYYSAKAETDQKWLNLAQKYENKYSAEVIKIQRANRLDTGTPRSFAPKKVPAYRKRYVL